MTDKSDPEGPYVCTLDEATRERAKQELKEDEKNLDGAIETLREWVKQQKWLKTPTDTHFLLRFLRTQKYTQLQARRVLEGYWTARTQNTEWFGNKDPNDPKIQEIINLGMYLQLPKLDSQGRKYLIVRLGAIDPKELKKTIGVVHVFRTATCIMDWMTMDPRTQINGVVIIMDLTGYTNEHRSVMDTPENIRKIINTIQNVYPMRLKAVNVYNLSPIFEAVLVIGRQFMKAKFKERLKTHGRSLVSLYGTVEQSILPVEYLPDDYEGPNGGTMQSIIEHTKNGICQPEVVEHIKSLSNGQYGVDLSLKPKDEDLPASFRKLHTD